MNIHEYFDKIIVINLARRTDRWAHCVEQFNKFDLHPERFDAHDMPGWSNNGCTASHRGVLELICHHRWPRTLVLEDDFQILHPDFHEKFFSMIDDVPKGFEMIYLGGHYAEKPQGRVTAHVIRTGHIKTTSSYGVTYSAARKMAPHIYGVGPIDELYRRFNLELESYIFQPRLMIQYANHSDIQGRECDNGLCMLDVRHQNMV